MDFFSLIYTQVQLRQHIDTSLLWDKEESKKPAVPLQLLSSVNLTLTYSSLV